MSATKLTFEEFLQLPEEPGKRYELSQGELIVEPSPTLRHSAIRSRIARLLDDLVKTHALGAVTEANDFRLAPDVVRNPDVAFVSNAQLRSFDVDRSPLEGTPILAVELISPSNSAEDMLLKVHQYLNAGCKAVWVVYPALRSLVVHDSGGMREFTDSFEETKLFGGLKFVLPLDYVFDPDITK
jgi:Uma2 family endonuclease